MYYTSVVQGNDAEEKNMKISTNPQEIQMARELKMIGEQLSILKKRDDEIKNYFKTNYASEGFIKLDNIMIVMSNRETSSLDRKALEAKLGIDNLLPFITKTPYISLSVKDA